MGALLAAVVVGAGLLVTAPTATAATSVALRPVHWAQVDEAEPDSPPADSGFAAAGRLNRPHGVFRSLFQLDGAEFAGTRIHRVVFQVQFAEPSTCRDVPTELWQTRPISPDVPLTWNNSREHWLGGPLAAGNCAPGDHAYGFGSEALTAAVQRAADEGTGFTLGLRAADEHDLGQGKRFKPDSVVVVVEYNHPPDVPRVTNAKPCGTEAAPIPLNDSNSRRYTGVGSDADGDNLRHLLEIRRPDGTLVHSAETPAVPAGTAFGWPEVPAGVLVHGQTYHYRARSDDGVDPGPFSTPCYFSVDAVGPGTPRIESADFPDGEPVVPVRTTGTVKLNPAAAADGVVRYLYGFQSEKVTSWITANPDGTAELPVTLAQETGRLYVSAVDAAGNLSPRAPVWDLAALPNPAPPAHEPGDTTGDGRADVAVLLDHGFGRSVVWNVTAREGGFHTGAAVFDSGINGGLPADGVRRARGDFDGDGRTDLTLLRGVPGGGAELVELRSDGNRYGAAIRWSSSGETWALETTRTVAGDFDGDGRDDVAAQTTEPGGGWRVVVFRGGALNSPVTWLDSAEPRQRLVAGDFDGDGLADLGALRDLGGCRAEVVVHRSTGSAFAGGAGQGAGEFCASSASPVAGDFDGDGRADLVAAQGTSLVVFTAAAGFAPATWWQSGEVTGELSTGDFDRDGKDDLAAVRGDAGETALWTLRSSGTAFGNLALGWSATTGGVLAPPQP